MMSENIEIRRLKRNEVELLKGLPFSRHEYQRRRFLKQQAGELIFLAAWDNKLPVGQVLLQWRGGDLAAVRPQVRTCPEITTLYVSPNYRQRGIATQLLDKAESFAAEYGHRLIGLSVAVDNIAARALYERQNYEDSGKGDYTARGSFVDTDGRSQSWEETRMYLTKRLLPQEPLMVDSRINSENA